MPLSRVPVRGRGLVARRARCPNTRREEFHQRLVALSRLRPQRDVPDFMRTRSIIPVALIALAACFTPRYGRSQQSGQSPAVDIDKPTPVLKNKDYDVVLPVTVRDKKGALVTSLDKSDLSLTEEG